MSWTLAVGALVTVLVGWAHYFSTIPRDRVPQTPVLTFVTQGAGLILGCATLALGGAGLVPSALAVTAVSMGVLFFFVYSQRKTPLGEIQVEVGAPILPIDSVDSDGNPVHSDNWRGRRILLKFFRGSW